jgi:hypothetical protein
LHQHFDKSAAKCQHIDKPSEKPKARAGWRRHAGQAKTKFLTKNQ